MVQTLRPWPLAIAIDRASPVPIQQQIVDAIVEGIRAGRLVPGDILPGSRNLADTLNLNRKTVVLAFDELIALGWLESRDRRGTFVAASAPAVPPAAAGDSGRERKAVAPPPSGTWMWDDGAPDTRLMPVTALARSYRTALVALARRNRLADEDTIGTAALRREVSGMLNLDRGLATSPDRICITRGSQMAIFLTARILVRPGDRVAMEEPGYPQARAAFRAAGAQLVPIGVDGSGLKVEELERECRRGPIRCVYTTPHHQYPTTVALGRDRRQALMALAERHDLTVIEDDYDHEFHYERDLVLPLASEAQADRIVYIGTFSKLLAPSLRCGYIAANAAFIRAAAREVTRVDRLGDPVTEHAIADLIRTGEIRRHYTKAIRVYRDRRDAFAERLERLFGASAHFRVPDGGLAFWVRFAPPFGTPAFMARAREEGVRVLPARFFTMERATLAATRLGFAHQTGPEMENGLQALRRAYDRAAGA